MCISVWTTTNTPLERHAFVCHSFALIVLYPVLSVWDIAIVCLSINHYLFSHTIEVYINYMYRKPDQIACHKYNKLSVPHSHCLITAHWYCVHQLWLFNSENPHVMFVGISLCKEEQEMQRSTYRGLDRDVKLVLASPDWQLWDSPQRAWLSLLKNVRMWPDETLHQNHPLSCPEQSPFWGGASPPDFSYTTFSNLLKQHDSTRHLTTTTYVLFLGAIFPPE